MFCEEQLNIKPRLNRAGTKRLGKVESGKIRRLLIHLESEAAASEILANARQLRDSHDEYVSKNIFINADLSKEESKQAFERRQNRRGQQGSVNNKAPQRQESTWTQQLGSSKSPRNTSHSYIFHNTNRHRPVTAYTHSNLIDCSATTSQFNASDFPPLPSSAHTTNCSVTEPIADSNTVLNAHAVSYQPPNIAAVSTAN